MGIVSRFTVLRLMKKFGAERISLDAANFLAEFLEKYLSDVLKEALIVARHAKRKTVEEKDVKLVLERRKRGEAKNLIVM